MSERVVSKAALYGRVPTSLLLRPEVTGDECRLYAYLTTFDFKLKGDVWPGRDTAARDLGWSVRTIDRILALLAQHGDIKRVQAGAGRPARIELLADIVREPALPDMAALPDSVPSPARSRKRTSLERELNEEATQEELAQGRAVAAKALRAARAGQGFPPYEDA